MRQYRKERKEIGCVEKIVCNRAEKKFRYPMVMKTKVYFMRIINGDIFRKKMGSGIDLICVKNVTIACCKDFRYRWK